MNRLVEHIGFLLFEKDFVIIPGLGGFVVNKEMAYADDVKQVIHAPHYWIGFNQALTHNDGLLVELYMKTQSVSSLKAEQSIKEDVSDFKKELSVSRQVCLGNWGKLYLNEENIICFNNSSEANFLRPQMLGLDKVFIRSLSEIKAENAKEADSENGSTLKRAIAFAAVSAAAAILLFTISIPISDKKENSNQLAGFFPEKITHIAINQATNQAQDSSKVVALSQPESGRQSKAAINPAPSRPEEAKYFLIVGTFQTEAAANQGLKKLRSSGFPGSGIIANPKAKRIYIAKFSDQAEANKYLSEFVVQNPTHKDAWIYSSKGHDTLSELASE